MNVVVTIVLKSSACAHDVGTHVIMQFGLAVQFCWIPGHYGIDGNEIADKLAKKALELDQVQIHIPMGKGDAIALIKSQIMLTWQDEWESESNARHYYRKGVIHPPETEASAGAAIVAELHLLLAFH